MKRSVSLSSPKTAAVVLLAVMSVFLPACNLLGTADAGGLGELRVSFARNQEVLTRSGFNIPDTTDFILVVKGPDGKSVYEGLYGACPESLSLPSAIKFLLIEVRDDRCRNIILAFGPGCLRPVLGMIDHTCVQNDLIRIIFGDIRTSWAAAGE